MLLLCVSAAAVNAQQYPLKPIRIITAEAAGATDIAARLIAPSLVANLGQQVIIDNRPGAGSVTSIESVARATPDGYTLLLHGSPVWLMQFMRDNLPWDPIRDLAPVSLVVTLPNVLVVHPSLPVKTVRDLIAIAKARPGDLNYGAGSPGASNHLAAELFKSMAKVDMQRISYKGGGPAVLSLLGGHVQLMFATAASVKTHVESSKLRAVAVTSPQTSTLFPALPTVAASGLPGYEARTIYGMFAPAKIPPAVVNVLNREIAGVLAKAEVKERLFRAGVEAASSTPDQFVAIVKEDMAKWGKVIRDAGIREN